MQNNSIPQLAVSDFVALTNQTLEYAFPVASVFGEVAEFKISQGKWVSFKLKDSEALVGCFMTTFALRQPIENGMKVMVTAAPKLNNKGFFSLNIRTIKPIGEGSIKKGFDLLKAKLEAEGLFSPERKRQLPRIPTRVAVVSSTESAGYADFCKIINDRWAGLEVEVAHTQVQGTPAPDQMIRAIQYFNNLEVLPEVLVIIRGGGSAEDLMAFNDEPLARAIAGSRIPTLVGVGHEVDHTLADMVADVRAATPTNAAEILVPDKKSIIDSAKNKVISASNSIAQALDYRVLEVRRMLAGAIGHIEQDIAKEANRLDSIAKIVRQLNPETILKKGYAMIHGRVEVGQDIEIETLSNIITSEVKNVRKK